MAEKDNSGGGGIRNKVHNILMRSKYPQPEICFELDDSDGGTKWIAHARLGRFWITADGRKKQDCAVKIYEEMEQILQQNKNIFSPSLCFWGCCLALGGDESTNRSLPPQLEKFKKKGKGGKACKERKYERFVQRIGEEFFVICPRCTRKNFVKYDTCLVCKTELPVKDSDRDEARSS